MTINCSTFFRTQLLSGIGFAGNMNGGAIAVYAGGQPTNADQAAQGLLLGYITVEGLTWSAPDNTDWGITWEVQGIGVTPVVTPLAFTCTQSGVAGWFRILANTYDSGELSLTNARIDGSIGNGTGTNPTDMVWGNTTVVAGSSYPIQMLTFLFPPL
jgi:hypothetical protein